MEIDMRPLTAFLMLALLGTARADDPTQRLRALVGTPGIAGFEGEVRARLSLPGWLATRVDEAGNLIATAGSGSPHVLVVASLDEDGFFVSGITEEGYLRLQRVSTGTTNRLFDQSQVGQPVFITTTQGVRIPGVLGAASSHLLRGRAPATALQGLDDLWVDLGANSRADVARLGVKLLDPVSLRDRVTLLAEGRLAGVNAQARGGALALRDLAAGFPKRPEFKGTLTFAWVAQSTFGERGLARLARQVRPDRTLLLTRASLADPLGTFGRLGAGPMVGEGLAKELAASGIATQPLPAPRIPAPCPTPVAALALPCLYAQTPVETVATADVVALTRLLALAVGLPTPGEASALPEGPPAPQRPEPGLPGLLRAQVETYGASGHEKAVRDLIASQLPAWAKPEVDEAGNLRVTVGKGQPEILFVAHTDELGYEVTAVLEDGSATVKRLGGFTDSILEAHPLLAQTAKGPVPALLAPRQGYATAAEAQPRLADLRVVFGTASRAGTEALGVAAGTALTVPKRMERLGPNRVTARAMDDRCGTAVLVAALRRLDPAKVRGTVTFAWVTGEETGLLGSRALARRLHPAYAFAVDTFVSSDSPLDNKRIAHIPLGSGAVLRAIDNSSIAPPALLARLQAIAGRHGIPVAVGTTNGGNDGSAFSEYGAVVVGLSWPGRYSHSPVEVADLRDLGALVSLITAVATDLR
jgi:putative aminopeptidase